jgi:hypothetical protein
MWGSLHFNCGDMVPVLNSTLSQLNRVLLRIDPSFGITLHPMIGSAGQAKRKQ